MHLILLLMFGDAMKQVVPSFIYLVIYYILDMSFNCILDQTVSGKSNSYKTIKAKLTLVPNFCLKE